MIVARPLNAFSIGRRSVLSCQVTDENPNTLLGREFLFVAEDGREKRIRIDGVSTASDFLSGVYDLQYSGDTIESADITDGSVIKNASDGEPKNRTRGE